MTVELRPHVGLNLITKKEQCFEQYLVFEGHPDKMERVGVIGWKSDSKIVFLVTVDPLREERIRKEVSRQLKREAELISCPDLPSDLVQPPESSPYNEFNESDLT